MPACAIEDHDDALVRMSRGHLVKEDLHAFAIDVGEDQGVKVTIENRGGGIGVGIFLRDHGLANGPDRLGAPTAPSIRDSSKTRFVLKHQPDRFFPMPLTGDFREDFGEFFFHSSCADMSAFGCRLSGASLRQS